MGYTNRSVRIDSVRRTGDVPIIEGRGDTDLSRTCGSSQYQQQRRSKEKQATAAAQRSQPETASGFW